jgi:hypothetical protein
VDRRNFLRILPISAIAPKIVKDGVVSLELPQGGHYVIIADQEKVNIKDLSEMPAEFLPKGSTGGWIIVTRGNPEDAIKFYKLDE